MAELMPYGMPFHATGKLAVSHSKPTVGWTVGWLVAGYGGGLQQGGGGQQTLQEFPGGGYITTDSMGRLTSTNLGMCQGSGKPDSKLASARLSWCTPWAPPDVLQSKRNGMA